MMKKQVSERIKKIVDLVPKCSVLADVGCDHAHISIYLKEVGRVERVIASDLREGPLSRAKKNVEEKKLEASFDLRLCSGLDGVKPGEAEVILISGMGGILIRDILKKGIEVIKESKTLILEPQSDVSLVREFLRKNGFRIQDEDMVKEGSKVYPILLVENVKMEVEYEDCELMDKYGPILLKKRNEILREFLLGRKSYFQKLLLNEKFMKSMNEETEERIVEIRKEASEIEEALRYFDKENG